MMLFMSVVLPAPLRPISPAIVPVGRSNDMSRRICTDWIATSRLRISSMRNRLQCTADHVAPDFRVV